MTAAAPAQPPARALAEIPASRWYCIRTQPARERLAARCLPFLDGVEVFHPVVSYTQRTRSGLRMKRVSLFPNYLFSRFPPAISKQVAYTLGVARILRRGNGEYAEVPAEVMRELIQLAPNAILRLDDPDFQIGQHIKIIRGAFDGMEGSITRLAPAKRRVAVLLSFLGQELPVEIPIDQIDIPENNPRHRLIHKQMAGPGQG